MADADVGSLGVKDLRALISKAGLRHDDCLELPDLRQRAREAQARLKVSPPDGASAPDPAGRAGGGKHTAKRDHLAGYECTLQGPAGVLQGGKKADLVVIFLHGFGASNSDFDSLPDMLGLTAPEASLSILWVFPQAPVGNMFVPAWWTIDVMQWMGAMQAGEGSIAKLIRDSPPGLPECRASMLRLVAEARARAGGVDASRVVIGGFSQGAMTALDTALSMPDGQRVGGVVSVSGAPIVVEEWSKKLAAHRGLPVLVTHGTADSTLPFVVSGWLEEFLKHNGAAVDKVVHDGGHTLGPPNSVGSAIRRFILKAGAV
mmetsp:Transcript_11888/g.40543  ORF Transcript_11888/g.40543 Transcript_11888/m.40543 type:complete len:317 (+) Transcript_11888:27-977(+)